MILKILIVLCFILGLLTLIMTYIGMNSMWVALAFALAAISIIVVSTLPSGDVD